jgi:hypothetical protein
LILMHFLERTRRKSAIRSDVLNAPESPGRARGRGG